MLHVKRGNLQAWGRLASALLTQYDTRLACTSHAASRTLWFSCSGFSSGRWSCEGGKPEPAMPTSLLTKKLLDESELPLHRLPPWQSVPTIQLSERLANYRQELRLGRSRHPAGQESVLPFLEDALVEGNIDGSSIGVVSNHQGSPGAWKSDYWPKVSDDDEAQTLLAARANDIISVLMVIEKLVPLVPWQRRAISYAVGESKLPKTLRSKHTANLRQSRLASGIPLEAKGQKGHHRLSMEITATTALSMVTFLLDECLLSEESVANLMANHPWLLGIQNPKHTCGQFLESLRLIDMTPTTIAQLVTHHPTTLLADVERDVLPLLEYLTALGLGEWDSGTLISKAPWLLEQGGKDELAGWVAFWMGRGMQKSSVLSLITKSPKAISGSLQLTQLKLDWLVENADFAIDDFAQVPAAIELPLATHVGPRVAFAKRYGVTSNTSWCSMSNEQREFLLCMSEADFLSVLGQSQVEFHAFEGAWRGSEFRNWFRSQKPTEDLVSHYDSLEWLETDDMAEMREVHDRYLMRHVEAWEQQQDREREWKNVWQTWRRMQERREKADMNARQLKRRREEAATTIQLRKLLSKEDSDSHSNSSEADPTEPSLSISCTNDADSEGLSKFGDGSLSMSSIEKLFQRGILGATCQVSSSQSGPELPRGRGPAVGVHSLNRKALLAEAAVLHELQRGRDVQGLSHPHIECKKQVVDDREEVLRCVDGILSLLSCTEYGVLTPLAVNNWCLARGFSKSCIARAKGVISSVGSACVVAEPLWRYHNAAPLAWVLLLHPSCLTLSNQFKVGNLDDLDGPRPVLTGGAASVLRVVEIVLTTINQVSQDSPMLRSELDKICRDTNGYRVPSKHMSSAISALIEEGRILRQRQKGVPSGPMELRLIDLQKYINEEHSRWGLK
jgi:hypothetical protein